MFNVLTVTTMRSIHGPQQIKARKLNSRRKDTRTVPDEEVLRTTVLKLRKEFNVLVGHIRCLSRKVFDFRVERIDQRPCGHYNHVHGKENAQDKVHLIFADRLQHNAAHFWPLVLRLNK